jgi:hypothetical protein
MKPLPYGYINIQPLIKQLAEYGQLRGRLGVIQRVFNRGRTGEQDGRQPRYVGENLLRK